MCLLFPVKGTDGGKMGSLNEGGEMGRLNEDATQVMSSAETKLFNWSHFRVNHSPETSTPAQGSPAPQPGVVMALGRVPASGSCRGMVTSQPWTAGTHRQGPPGSGPATSHGHGADAVEGFTLWRNNLPVQVGTAEENICFSLFFFSLLWRT